MFLAALIGFCSATGSAQTRPTSEYQLKAAFLYEFGRFVEWPWFAESGKSQFSICVLGVDPFGAWLDDAVRSKTVEGLTVAARRILGTKDVEGCHVLFISSSEDNRLVEILGSMEGRGVLTVGEGMPFVRRGGMISFTIEDNRVRFAINKRAAEEAGLKLSSQLLRLATMVETQESGS
jgi:hypothetical protein